MATKNRKTRPSPEESARRLLILRQVVTYGGLNPPSETVSRLSATWTAKERKEFAHEAEKLRDAFWRSTRKSEIWSDMSPAERQLARSTAVTMTPQQRVDASWRLESARTLMWALRLEPDAAPYDSEADPDILKSIPSFEDQNFVSKVRLRKNSEIGEAREAAELWHWRSRTRDLIERGDEFPDNSLLRSTGLESYDDIVRHAARNAHDDGTLTHILDEDFIAFGKPYRRLRR